ncbi:hypothetical protein CSC2_44660 [Clostridium zeae]|uniref:Uncharacterized protein n=1 Tax=Clostridium zeae TaxID=2759022 RepID=A0ABQ1EGJ9_9CLOT|nr:hypothetical protein CSC2_44660 [Clostridium zeae]
MEINNNANAEINIEILKGENIYSLILYLYIKYEMKTKILVISNSFTNIVELFIKLKK